MVTIEDIKAVHSFFSKKGIPFILTGTAALDIHGILPEGYEPQDIDVLVSVSETTKEYVFKELEVIQNLTGCTFKSDYENECFNFVAGPNKVKVNAIIRHFEDGYDVDYISVTFGKGHLDVSTVSECLKAKAKLKRCKDYRFGTALISTILKMFNR